MIKTGVRVVPGDHLNMRYVDLRPGDLVMSETRSACWFVLENTGHEHTPCITWLRLWGNFYTVGLTDHCIWPGASKVFKDLMVFRCGELIS